jgi:tetratricopeptide (TPR) repeat protein
MARALDVVTLTGEEYDDLMECKEMVASLLAQLSAAKDRIAELTPVAGMDWRETMQRMLTRMEETDRWPAICDEARAVLVGIGALDLTNLTATAVYADTADSQARHLMALGRLDEAAALEQEVYDLAEKVLAERPGDFRSMRNRALAADLLGVLAERRHDHEASLRHAANAEAAGENYVRFNPSDMTAWFYWVRGKDQLATALFEQGRVTDALAMLRSAVALEQDSRVPAPLGSQLNFTWSRIAALELRLGRHEAGREAMNSALQAHELFIALTAEGSARRALTERTPEIWQARLELWRGDDAAALATSQAAIERLNGIAPPADDLRAGEIRGNLMRFALATAGMAAIELGRHEEAESLTRARLQVPPNLTGDADPQDETSRANVVLAHALAMQGRNAEALEFVRPVVEGYRAEQKAGAGGTTFQRDLAYALYVDALAQPDGAAGRMQRAASLAEAARVLDGMSAEARSLSDHRELAERISRAGATAAAP